MAEALGTYASGRNGPARNPRNCRIERVWRWAAGRTSGPAGDSYSSITSRSGITISEFGMWQLYTGQHSTP